MISPEQYAIERAICDKAENFAEQFRNHNGWIVIPSDAAKHPDYAACDNDMRARVEEFEFFRDMPERYGAYIATDTETRRCPGEGEWIKLTLWTGVQIGKGMIVSSWCQGATRMFSGWVRARNPVTGEWREYAWRGQGVGMYASLRAKKIARS